MYTWYQVLPEYMYLKSQLKWATNMLEVVRCKQSIFVIGWWSVYNKTIKNKAAEQIHLHKKAIQYTMEVVPHVVYEYNNLSPYSFKHKHLGFKVAYNKYSIWRPQLLHYIKRLCSYHFVITSIRNSIYRLMSLLIVITL